MRDHICSTGCNHFSHLNDADLQGEFKEARQSLRAAIGGKPTAGIAGLAGVTERALPSKKAGEHVSHYYVPANNKTIHWGYFSKTMEPLLKLESGDYATIETITHHSNDDIERMVKGDAGAESIFQWDANSKAVDRRGAGPMDDPLGAGGGLGVHVCTGPIYVNGAEPGDVLEVRIVDTMQRPSGNPDYRGKTFGSNVASNWGFHYNNLITEPKGREVITIYEVDASGEQTWAKAVYNYRWTPQTDPFGVVHPIIDYPGVPVDKSSIKPNYDVLKGYEIPVRPHFGMIGVAPVEADMVSSIIPSYSGGNFDNWRMGKGATAFFPVVVPGAMFSVGDPHASQGDAELCGTAIECSLTGLFQFILHKKADLPGTKLYGLDYPLLETESELVVHGFSSPNYLKEFGVDGTSELFKKSSLDSAMTDAFNKTRRFFMDTRNLTEDEAISLISVSVDFGITQVVDGNWGVHAIIKKAVFPK
ncbi:acetamidase/formamidase family protein [Herminiimonas contaminans]|uniref:Acetamidase/formamidase family protein n=1 Tax=Herminiimonas contaminans TaxID=1111140 RepID=A0ABS0EXH3_9BURK|nr:acetamidase/formamidase family protein [Herminiimonas contaminans]MBF8179542.1 acetamidase/formamidase family protein [Herminiimonas contaminans]